MVKRTAVGIVVGVLLGVASAALAQPLRRLPIFVGALALDAGKAPRPFVPKGNGSTLRACAVDGDMPSVIKKTLAQMGDEVQDWPTTIPRERCLGIGCAKRLRSAVHEGYLLGGQISTQPLGPAHLDLWLIDLGGQRIMLAQHDCLDCEKPEVVARHAAAVVQRRTEPQAPWFPLPELDVCLPRGDKVAGALLPEAATPEVPEVIERARPPILLAVYGTRVPEKLRHSVTQGTKQYLELLGQPVQEFRYPIHPEAPRSSLRPQQQAAWLLDIEIQGAGSKLTDVLLRLSDAQDTRQTTFQCANLKDCTPAALVQQVQLHVGTLVDRLAAPPQLASAAEAASVCLPAPVCAMESAKFVVAELTPPAAVSPPPPAAATPPASDGRGAVAVNRSTDAPPGPAPGSMLALCPPPGRARKLKIAGWSLVGLGGALVVAAIAPSVLSTIPGRCKNSTGQTAQFCDPLPSAPNLWPVAGVGYGLGALSIAGGIGLLAWSQKQSSLEVSQGGSACLH